MTELNFCWICNAPAVGIGQRTLSVESPIGSREVGVCLKHIASVVNFTFYPPFEDHTFDDAEYDWLRDKEVKDGPD